MSIPFISCRCSAAYRSSLSFCDRFLKKKKVYVFQEIYYSFIHLLLQEQSPVCGIFSKWNFLQMLAIPISWVIHVKSSQNGIFKHCGYSYHCMLWMQQHHTKTFPCGFCVLVWVHLTTHSILHICNIQVTSITVQPYQFISLIQLKGISVSLSKPGKCKKPNVLNLLKPHHHTKHHTKAQIIVILF